MLNRYPFLRAMSRKGGLTLWGGFWHLAFILIPLAVAATLFVYIQRDPSRSSDYPGLIIPLIWAFGMLVALFVRVGNARAELAYEISLWGDLHQLAPYIEADFGGRRPDGSPLQVGERWLCYVRGDTAYVLPMDYLAWAQPTLKGMVLHTRQNDRRPLAMSPWRVRESLNEIRQRAPWVMIGASQVLENSWMDDRADVLRKIDQARAERRRFSDVAGVLAKYVDE